MARASSRARASPAPGIRGSLPIDPLRKSAQRACAPYNSLSHSYSAGRKNRWDGSAPHKNGSALYRPRRGQYNFLTGLYRGHSAPARAHRGLYNFLRELYWAHPAPERAGRCLYGAVTKLYRGVCAPQVRQAALYRDEGKSNAALPANWRSLRETRNPPQETLLSWVYSPERISWRGGTALDGATLTRRTLLRSAGARAAL